MLGDYLRNVVSGIRYSVPELHHRPKRAVEQIAAAVEGVAQEDLTLVGSSLGGWPSPSSTLPS